MHSVCLRVVVRVAMLRLICTLVKYRSGPRSVMSHMFFSSLFAFAIAAGGVACDLEVVDDWHDDDAVLVRPVV